MIGYLIDKLLTLIGLITAYECPLCLREYAEWRPSELCRDCERTLGRIDAQVASDRRIVAQVLGDASAAEAAPLAGQDGDDSPQRGPANPD